MGSLIEIQAKLKAPKNQYNKFGKYNFRSCEDIFEAVKPLLGDSLLTLSDDIVEVGGRVYVKATAIFADEGFHTQTTAYAREPAERKGMDASQITGTASSYARKTALGGLFLIDDTKDVDTMDNREPKVEPKRRSVAPPKVSPTGDVAPDSINKITEAQRKTLITLMEEKGLLKAEQKAFFDYVIGAVECSSVRANHFIRNFETLFEGWSATVKLLVEDTPTEETTSTEEDTPERAEFANLKVAGFATWVFKNKGRIALFAPEVQAEIQDKWARLYPGNPFPTQPERTQEGEQPEMDT